MSSDKEITNSIGMKLVLIPAGSFMMGSPKKEKDRDDDEEQQRKVTLTKAFYLGMTQVTQAQYEKVMGENPSYFQGDKVQGDSSNHPVEMVSWGEAVEFCKKLSDLPEEKQAGRVYRLPTEAEWEYACRAGSTTAFSFGESSESLGEYAWYHDNSDSSTHPVALRKPNAWGLYDMHGNVKEWCADWFGYFSKSAASDPVGPSGGWGRVFRGGSWRVVAAGCRSACRAMGPRLAGCDSGGFRVALSSPAIPK